METNNEFRILRVDLTTGRISEESLSENLYRKYVGGWNVILHYMLKEIPRGAGALSPDNVLVFAGGALTGTPVGCAGRNSAGAKSPLTGGCALCEAGGYFGSELRRAGYDGLVFTGASKTPVYLSILDGQAALHPADHLWGLTVGDAEERIRLDLGERLARTALIGPAGEKQVPLACILNDLSHAYGRGGLGAVMGSKKLKGIAVRGKQRPAWADPEATRDMGKWFSQTWPDATPTSKYWAKHGTMGSLGALDAAGGLPTRNFQQGKFTRAEEIIGERMTEAYLVKTGTCFACPISCKREVAIEEPYLVEPRYGGPEYETGAAFGSDCGVSDLAAICKANEICNAYGLDTISVGATIAWAMECHERGLIGEQVYGDVDLAFGNGETLVTLVQQMAEDRGFGKILGLGCAKAAEKLGFGAEYAMHVKGQELPMHEPRIKQGLGLSYAVSPTGADHMHAIHDGGYVNPTLRMQQLGFLDGVPALELSPAKVRLSYYEILLNTLYNLLVTCDAARQPYRFDIKHVLAAMKAVTGWDMTAWELMKAAERATTLARVFNLREGFSRADDWLPERFFEELEGSPGSRAIDKGEFSRALRLFYEMMGWDGLTGVPTPGTLEELDVGWAREQLLAEPQPEQEIALQCVA